MPTHKSSDVLVAGAGPVGLLAALTLAQRGASVQILDEERRPGAQSYALALHPGTMEILDRLGLREQIIEAGHSVNSIAFYDEHGRLGEIPLERLQTRHPAITVLGQDVLEKMLETQLHRAGVDVRWNHRLAAVDPHEDHVSAGVDELDSDGGGYATYTTDWAIERSFREETAFIIGADGYRSCLRRALDIEYPEVAPPQLYAIFEFATGEPLDNEVRIVLGEDFTDVLWPLGENRCRWSFQLHNNLWGDDFRSKQRLAVYIGGAAYPHLTMDELRSLARRRAPWFEGWIGDMRWALMVRFEQRLAHSFGRGRCWLAGDSAHLAAPVGVHSMNIGLREAYDLANRMADILARKLPLNSLDAYNTARLAEWRRHLTSNLLLARDGAPAWVRGREQRIMASLPASGPLLTEMLEFLGIGQTSLETV